MSTASRVERLPWESMEPVVQVVESPGFPAGHLAEADLFVRQERMPGHDQAAIGAARVVVVGAGGLGSWVGLALVRSGIGNLTIIDPDRFDRTNAHRQLMFAQDMGRPKASRLVKNLVPHMIAGGRLTAINANFAEAVGCVSLAADVLLVLVDNNHCRRSGSQWARSHRIPAVFAMLSLDGLRLNAFLQGAEQSDACLWCALPNLDTDAVTPCAAASIVSCLQAASVVTFLTHRAIMGWPAGHPPINWVDLDLSGTAPDRRTQVARRTDCRVCGC
jgi:molybdopterin-synthase adenylyltransferase